MYCRARKAGVAIVLCVIVGLSGCVKVVNYRAGDTDENDMVRGDGNVTTVDVSASNFSKIVVGAADVRIGFGDGYSVKVTTAHNIQKLVSVSVSGGVLNIAETGGFYDATIVVDIMMPRLQTLELLGAGNAVIASGSADAFELALSGVGSVDAQDYKVKNVTANISGIGSAKVWATDSLSGEISGLGSVHYKGDPALNVNSEGLGSFKPM